ncbi:MAG TPA: hypothetical protein PKW98_05400 [Candidatus Wallbacteria bacterium]|nr:hypothetical protein [Candidatus Wallbacteria bacterium]HPG57233.1 hypothetical protein [Candidatus Wallbacteria bacterium]
MKTCNMNMPAQNGRRAFTVMEVVIVAMISVFAFGVIYMFWARTQENFMQGNFKYILQHEGQKLIEMIRQDLLQSCKIVKDETGAAMPVVNKLDDTWSFLKFNSELVQGRPLVEKVTYDFKKSEGKVYRLVERDAQSALAKSENKVIALKVVDFQINPYTLNGLKYFQLIIKVGVSAAETHIRSEELTLITTVESRFDNNYINQKGWNDNIQTKIYTK